MGHIRAKQIDIDDDWTCPGCGQSDGIELMCMVPTYEAAEPYYDNGRWVATSKDYQIDVFWEGADPSVVMCLNCREVLDMEII